MRNLKTIITIIAISLATTFSTTAGEKKPSKVTKKLRTEIVSMLGDQIQMELKNVKTAKISFMVNNQNEVIVVSVSSKAKDFNSFVKHQLNYKKINIDGVKKGVVYNLPVKIKTKIQLVD